MPFMGRDWRSPGEAWVKTESLGWQRMKIIESQLYLKACHPNHSACSWPPRNQFGQHMANNCNKTQESDCDRRVICEVSDCPSGGSLTSSVDTNSGDSSDSSRHSSAASSPTGTPEKNNSSRHIHPIAISSPYGRFTTQCDSENSAHPRRVFRVSTPILMKNGISIDGQELSSTKVDANTPVEGESSDLTGKNYNDDRSASSTPLGSPPPTQDNDQSPQSICCCCCCTSHTSSSQPYQHFVKEQQPKTAPHCRISVRTREVAMHNTISEAFYRLDFYNAIHDIRRFNYICKLLHLLITQNLTSLSGCATRVLFTMLEQVAWEVSSNKRNIHVIRNLLNELKSTIQKYYCWGRPIGSSLLWQQHFETIERINQIVNGIELSPPQDNNSRANFNSLPIEMIREILLRLNDHRDLINSAQASPVMRTMIDDQCIWKKLCRYHFTDQQLKIVFENNDSVPRKKRVLRGIKYARTTSADGQKSYRKPVTHKQSSQSTSSTSASNATTSTRQQLEETANRRNPNARRGSNGTSSRTSHVTDTLKIFDQAGRSTGNGAGPSYNTKVEAKENQQQISTTSQSRTENARLTNPNRTDSDIDWERVFHQLRKKFDLKEEYPDCLLLCRQCRCLFWKSFGHPCIKSDDLERERTSNQQESRESTSSRDRSMRSQPYNLGENNSDSLGGRLSVASLSRNFDRQVPYGGASSHESELREARQRAVLNANQDHHNGRFGDPQRRPFNELSAQLREQNENRLQRQQNRHQNGERDNGHLGTSRRREELVPKHVTITPQAFLKFFSL